MEQLYGPLSVDLMALDSNTMHSSDGQILLHFTPGPSLNRFGVNVFAQDISTEVNPYVFPPFNLIMPLLSLWKEQNVKNCIFFAPEKSPKSLSGGLYCCLVNSHW